MATFTIGNRGQVHRFTYDPAGYGRLLSVLVSGSTERFFLFDALGSTDRLLATNHGVTDQYLYEAFGKEVLKTGTTRNPFRWLGQIGYYTDNETSGVPIYVRARQYSPVQGRWLSVDPLGMARVVRRTIRRSFDKSFYEYVANNAVRRVDPNGMDWLDCMAKCVGENDFPWEVILGTCVVGARVPKGVVIPGQSSTESVLVKCCVRTGAGKWVVAARWVSRAAIVATLIEGAWDWVAITKCSIECS